LKSTVTCCICPNTTSRWCPSEQGEVYDVYSPLFTKRASFRTGKV
jgi:hypothetical protein